MPQSATVDAPDELDQFVQSYQSKAAAPPPSDDELDSFVKSYKTQQPTPVEAKSTIPIVPFAPPVQTQPLDQRAAKMGASMIPLTPPPADTTQLPQNVFENAPQRPPQPNMTPAPPKSSMDDMLDQEQAVEGQAHQQGAALVNKLSTGSKKLPLPYMAPDGSLRTMKLGDFQQLASDYLDDPSIEKSRGAAFAAGAAADTVSTLNDIFFSPLGMASSVTGLAAARALQTAGKQGTAAIKLAQEYQAMKQAGATADELAAQEQLVRQAVASTARTQSVVAGAETAQKAAGVGFGMQGASQIVSGIQRKDYPTVLSGLASLAIGGSEGLSGLNGEGIQESVKARTAEAAVDNLNNEAAPEEPTVPFRAPGEKNVTAQGSHEIVRPPQLPAPTEAAPVEAAKSVGVGEELTPEKPETLQAQTDALANGTNPVVYIPKGQTAPVPPEGAKVTEVGGNQPGAGTYYHDDSVTPAQIKSAVKDGTYGQLLGNVQSKQEAIGQGGASEAQGAVPPVAVTARDDRNNEVQSSLVAGNDAKAQAEQSANLSEKFPNAKIGVETPEQVVEGRKSSPQDTAERLYKETNEQLKNPNLSDYHRAQLLANQDLYKNVILDKFKGQPLSKEDIAEMANAKPGERLGPAIENLRAATEDVRLNKEYEESKQGRQSTAIEKPSVVDLNKPIPDDVARILNKRIGQANGGTPPFPLSEMKKLTTGQVLKGFGKVGLDEEVLRESASALYAAGYRQIGHVKITSEGLELPASGEATTTPIDLTQAASRETPQAGEEDELDKFVREQTTVRAPKKQAENAYGKQQAQLYANRQRDPVEREYAQSYLKAAAAGKQPPKPSKSLAADRARIVSSNIDKYLHTPTPKSLAEKYDPELLKDAHAELEGAHKLASSFERPGRYYAEGSAANEPYAKGTWYGVNSSRHLVADQYPWFADIPQGADKIGELVKKGKGAEYDRVIDKIAASIQKERESAAPVIKEFAPKLKELSKQLAESDPDLSETLGQLANGDGRGFKNLRQYVEEKINDAERAQSFFSLIDDAAEEAREAGAEESTERGDESGADEGERIAETTEPTESSNGAENSSRSDATSSTEAPFNLTAQKSRARNTEHQNVIPGFEQHVAEQKSAAGRVQGERLSEEANRSLGNVESAAGEMERNSPLFRGSGASAQRDLGPSEAPAKVGDHVTAKSGALKGKTFEVTKVGATGVYGTSEDGGPIRFLKIGEFGPLLDSEGKPIATGPGTPLRDAFDKTGTRIQQLADVIRENVAGSKPINERMDYADKMAESKAKAKDETDRALGKVKGAMAAMWDAYSRPPKWGDYEEALGKYHFAITKSAAGLKDFAHSIKKAIPDPKRREAVTNFIEAGGDRATLEKWAAEAKPKFKAGYKAALTLTNVEQTIARNIIATQDERFELDKAAGLLEHEVDNYVMHAWKRENPYTKKLVSNVRAQMLQTKPSFTKQRVFGTFFDGEKAGYSPVSKDIGFLFAAREHAADQAIAARAFIKSMLDGKASDGKPLVAVSGSGRPIAEEEKPAKAYLIDAKTKPEDVADYKSIDHPALRKWNWAQNDSTGKPIFVKGDLVVHPEAYSHLKNVLGKSALRSFAPFHAIQAISQHFKATELSFSMFHQTQESLHSIFHRSNPFNTKPIDFSNPKQAKLIDHGLQVASFDAQQAFGEGLGAGVPNRLPIVGKYLQRYNEYLFGDFIPRLKMALAEHALDRNFKRYAGKISEDQIYALTANQANSAFGELNYTMLGRNKTMQDVLRMALLAPDFLEARGRFVGQALKPYGREQALALITGALLMYVAARILNQLLTGNPRWEAQNVFDVVYKGRAYTLRSVPADLIHLFTDPRGFIYNRLNPIYGRGAVEGITGRDKYGRKQSVGQQVKDTLSGGLPIPVQGLSKGNESGPLETALSSTGVSTFPYKSPAERLAQRYTLDSMPLGEESKDRKDANHEARSLEDKLRKKEISPRAVRRAYEEGKITSSDRKRILARAARTPLQNSFRSLTPQQAIDVWDKANTEERKQIRPLLANKLSRLNSVPVGQRTQLKERIFTALHGGARPSSSPVPRHAPGSQ